MVHRRAMSQKGQLVPLLLKPKGLIIVALILCWSPKNGSHADHRNNHHTKNLRMRAPSSYLRQIEIKPQDQNPIADSMENGELGPFLGNLAAEGEKLLVPKQKKRCRESSIATRGILGPTVNVKRSFFATTEDEMEDKKRSQETRKKRQAPGTQTTPADPALPWSCETKYIWHDMGMDHYPRFIRTAECTTRSCFNGFFRCKARRYKTKVLKRVSPSDSTSCEEEDVSLPETLRSQWRFITITISLCCDCVGRLPTAGQES